MEPSAWSQMSPAAQAAYYNQNPTMAAITQAGQKAFGYAMPGLAAAQQYLAPDFVRDQEMIAMGLNPNQNFDVPGFNYGGDYDSFASDRSSAGMGGAYEGSAGSTAATADMPDGPDGANASSGGCVIATHAVSSGAFTPREKRQAELWCIKKLHNKWWGEAIRRGYRYHGNASIKGGRAATHYQEFRDFVDFGSGKRRNAKTAFTFAWRSVQFFFTGLLVKS
jgi:hypothetical protein